MQHNSIGAGVQNDHNSIGDNMLSDGNEGHALTGSINHTHSNIGSQYDGHNVSNTNMGDGLQA